MYFRGTQSAGGSGAIESNIASSEYHNPLTDIDLPVQVDVSEKLYPGYDLLQIYAWDIEGLFPMSPNRQEHGIKLIQLLKTQVISQAHTGLYLHPNSLDEGDFTMQNGLGQSVFRDTHPEHTPSHRQSLKDGDPIAMLGQVVGTG